MFRVGFDQMPGSDECYAVRDNVRLLTQQGIISSEFRTSALHLCLVEVKLQRDGPVASRMPLTSATLRNRPLVDQSLYPTAHATALVFRNLHKYVTKDCRVNASGRDRLAL
jgi:hypothetical protein